MNNLEFYNSREDNFVGLKYEDKKIKVYFPRGYKMPSIDDKLKCQESIWDLINLVSLTKKIEKNNKFDIIAYAEQESPINSYYYLLNDYLNNGLYYDVLEKYVQNQSGKINWKKTLNTKFYVSKNRIVFLNPYVEKKTSTNNIITEIQMYCINKSIDLVGWLFGNIEKLNNSINMEENLEYYLNVVDRELLISFDDKKKKLLMHMKRVLIESCDNENIMDDKEYGTCEFEYAWEEMIRKVFGNRNLDDFLPSATWYFSNDERAYPDSYLRPDSILEYNNKIYILDAKYYKYGITKNKKDLPDTSSIAKQIIYYEYVKQKYAKKIYTAFLLPYNSTTSMKIEGCGHAKFLKESVALIIVDMNYLIDCYFKRELCNFEDLTRTIEKYSL